jgi:penicillin-binding protein 1A
LIYQAEPSIACVDLNCQPGQLKHPAPRTIDADVAFLINNALQDVIVHGTGQSASVIGRKDLAGKTGTTNQQMDAWFSGFNAHVVTTVWVGFDQPKSLYEYGRQAALPIWIDYMEAALKNQPEVILPTPNDIIMVRIDPNTGLLAAPGQKDGIFEMFRKDDAPTDYASAQQHNTSGVPEGDDDSGLF